MKLADSPAPSVRPINTSEALAELLLPSKTDRMEKRSPKDVIDQAIREGRTGLLLAYLSIVVSLTFGVGGLVQASVSQQPLVAVIGGVLSICIWPSMSYALQVRRETIALRLLEIPLSQTRTAEEAAKLLQDFFRAAYFGGGGAS